MNFLFGIHLIESKYLPKDKFLIKSGDRYYLFDDKGNELATWTYKELLILQNR